MTAPHLASENVAALGRRSLGPLVVSGHSTGLAVRARSGTLTLDFSNHLHLIWILHYKLPSIASISCAYTAGALVMRRATTAVHLMIRHYLALGSYCWDFVVIFLQKTNVSGS